MAPLQLSHYIIPQLPCKAWPDTSATLLKVAPKTIVLVESCLIPVKIRSM